MFLDAPLALRLPVQTLVWCWVVLLPGLALTAELLRARRPRATTLAALSIGLGLVAVPTVVHALVFVTGRPMSLEALLICAAAINALGAWRWWRGPRLQVEGGSWGLWLAVAAVAVVMFTTTDGTYPLVAADGWKSNGTTQCFMEGTYRYMGVPTPAPPRPFGPPLSRPTDGGEFITFGNVALASTHMLIYGAAGLRVLRVVIGVLLGLLGWIAWEHLGGRPRWALVGLAVFALNPYVVTTREMDRNLVALSFAALLYVLTAVLRLGPLVPGLVAGFAVGVGLNLIPVLYLIPLVWHFGRRRNGHRRRDLAILLGSAAVVGALWAVLFLPFPLGIWPSRRGHVGPWTYDIAGLHLRTRFLLGFPFASPWVRGLHNPFPPWLHFPLHIYRTFGALAVGVAALGLLRSWRRSAADTLWLLAWGAPMYLALATMAVFTDYLQTRLIFAALLPFLVLVLEGVRALADRPRSVVAVLVAGAVAVGLAMAAARADLPVDPRMRDPRFSAYITNASFLYGGESVVDRERRAAYLAPRLLPDYRADPGLRNVISSPMPPGYYEHRVARLGRLDDLLHPDIFGRAPFTSPPGASRALRAHSKLPPAGDPGERRATLAGFVPLPAGSFTMGSPPTERGRGADETPHTVRITRPFLLGSREVTQAQYRALIGSNPSYNSACGDACPVERVSWLEAVRYANARSSREGLPTCYAIDGDHVSWPKGLACRGYRLPTEAEWEYAFRHHAPGLRAMIGGAWEWCWDWYGPYPRAAVDDPTGPESGVARISRGSWANSSERIRAACRRCWSPDTRYRELGFRLARTVP